jgi:phosphate transport system permease protein
MAETKVLPRRRRLVSKPTGAKDKLFFRTATAAAYLAIVLVGLILAFLLWRAWPTFEMQGIDFIFGSTWSAVEGEETILQIGPMLWGSLLIAIVGIIFAVPMAIAVAYFIEFLAPTRVAKVATILVDLLAALPSIVIGLWGVEIFAPEAAKWSMFLNETLGWFPVFSNESGNFIGTPFIAGCIVAVMIVPIIASVTREIFSQMDRDLINASIALGAGRASTFRRVIMPTASGGVVGGVLLGLGRALGETVAIFFVLNLAFDINLFNVLESRGGSIASLILSKFGEATTAEISGLMAAGLVLFVVTLLVSTLAAYIVNKAQPWRKL